jgi:hypothetical protein
MDAESTIIVDNVPAANIYQQDSDLHTTGRLKIVTSDGISFLVDKCVLATYSSVFENMFTSVGSASNIDNQLVMSDQADRSVAWKKLLDAMYR